ncbi:MAG: 4Fe-4S dicluster domain-containing protein [Burkholderiaceae bacterium]
MSKGQQADGILAFYEEERARILDACSRCGKCFEVCPMVPHLDLGTRDAAGIVSDVLSILGRQAGPEAASSAQDALKWMLGCTGSGVCIPACPESVNPKMMLRIARITALGGLGDPKLASKPEDPNWFPRIRAFAQMQLSDDEQKEWM